MYYINNFLFFSLFGHVLESIVYFILDNGGHSGILYGPWTPAYGFGIVLIIVIHNILNKTKITGFKKILLLFLISSLTLTVIEYIGGISIEYFFHKKLWSYKDLQYNIGRYIALEISIVWGLCSILYIYLVKPYTDKIIKRIPYYITIPILVFFIIDFIITVIDKIK